jgi:sphinganine-1-phosphate aldolase
LSYLIRKQFEKARKDAIKFLPKTNLKLTKVLPKEGLKIKDLKKRLEEFEEIESEVKNKGKYSGSVFSTEEDLVTLNKEVSKLFLFTDLAQPQIYKYSKQLENEVVAMIANLFKGNSRCTGLTTTGGSESLELAVQAHCAYYRRKKGITRPEVVVCETVHAAIYKACEFFDVKLVVVEVDRDLNFDLRRFQRAINANTVLMVSSVPNYPYGYCDPVEPLAKLAVKHDIGLHLDMCLGGFLVPFAKEKGYKLPEEAYDFSVKGVSSISVDPHKYGLSAKGISVLVFSDHDIQQSLYFCKADGPNPPYASGSIYDAHSAAVVAACWATMMYYGYDGYARLAKEVFDKTAEFSAKVRKVPGIEVVGDPIVDRFYAAGQCIDQVDRQEGEHLLGRELRIDAELEDLVHAEAAIHACDTPKEQHRED